MNTAVALVQAYLYANGYFTVTEYPVIEAVHSGAYREATDLDVLAVRFPGAGRLVVGAKGQKGRDFRMARPDPALRTTDDRVDLIIAEVKRGRADLNQGARNPAVLRAALARFGAASKRDAERVVESLLERGETISPSGQRIRLLAFGSHGRRRRRRYRVITLGHIVRFLREYLEAHWDVMQNAQFRDPAMSFLSLIHKSLREDPEAP